MSRPLDPARILRASSLYGRNRAALSRSIFTTPRISAPSSAVQVMEEPAYDYDYLEDNYRTRGYDARALEREPIDWREWPIMPLEALEPGYEGVLDKTSSDREFEWPEGMSNRYGATDNEPHKVKVEIAPLQADTQSRSAQPDLSPSTHIDPHPVAFQPLQTSTSTLTTALSHPSQLKPAPRSRPDLPQAELNRIFLNRLSAVTNKIQYRREKARGKRAEVYDPEAATGYTTSLDSTVHIAPAEMAEGNEVEADSEGPVTARRASLEAGRELAKRWQNVQRQAHSSSRSVDGVEPRRTDVDVSANDIWAGLMTGSEPDNGAEASPHANRIASSSSYEASSHDQASSGASGGESSSGSNRGSSFSSNSSPSPDRPFRPTRSKKPTTRAPSIPSIPFDPGSMSLLTSITSFRRPATKAPSTLSAPDVQTLFALKPTRATPHHTSKHYKTDYEKLWNRVWVTFTAPKIIGVYNDMMDLPDPTDITVLRQPDAALHSKWPRASPAGGARTGIWIRSPTPTDPERVIWKRAVKRTVVNEILSVWGWRPLEELEADAAREKAMAKTMKRDYELSAGEMALLIVNPESGRALRETFGERATFSLVESERVVGKALRARATGRDQLEIEAWLEERKKEIRIDYISLPSASHSLERLYKAVSKLSGAHLSPFTSETSVEMQYISPDQREHAIRLFKQAQRDVINVPSSALVVANLSNPGLSTATNGERFALYPHMPVNAGSGSGLATSSPDEWILEGLSAYRMRRTGGWFGKSTSGGETIPADATAKTVVLRPDASGQSSLEDALSMPDRENGEAVSYTVSIGHLLYTTRNAIGLSLIAPLAGSRSIEEIAEWSRSQTSGPIFSGITSQANSATEVTEVGKETRRLRYYPDDQDGRAGPLRVLEVVFTGELVEASEVREKIVNVSRPNSDTDVQITIKRSTALPTVPAGLGIVDPIVPSTVRHQGITYRLCSDERVMLRGGGSQTCAEEHAIDRATGMFVRTSRVATDPADVMQVVRRV